MRGCNQFVNNYKFSKAKDINKVDSQNLQTKTKKFAYTVNMFLYSCIYRLILLVFISIVCLNLPVHLSNEFVNFKEEKDSKVCRLLSI